MVRRRRPDTGEIHPPPGANQLASAGNLDLGQPYTEAKLQEAQAAQKRLMEMNGLFKPALHPVFEWDDTYQQVRITFQVDSGDRARFGPPVVDGDLKMGLDRITKSLKFRRWLIHTWKPMTQTRMQQGLNGVRDLYQKQNRLEAKVSLEGVKYNAETNVATPSLHIEAGPRIDVRAIGAKISDGQLRKYVPVYQEHAVDNDLLVEGAHNLRDYLQTTGYFDADVQFKQQNVINDKADIDYLIAPGERHKVTAILISGNKVFDTTTIRERMYLRAASFLQFPHGRYSENLPQPRRGFHPQPLPIERLPRCEGHASHRRSEPSPGIRPARCNSLYQYRWRDRGILSARLTVTGIESIDRAKILSQLSSAENQPFSEYNVALDREAIWIRYFEKDSPTQPSNGVPLLPPSRTLRSNVFDYRGRQEFVRQVIYTETATPSRSSLTACSS